MSSVTFHVTVKWSAPLLLGLTIASPCFIVCINFTVSAKLILWKDGWTITQITLFINIILYVYIVYSPPFMIFVSEIAALAGTFDTESIYFDFNDPAMNNLSHTDSLAGVCDVPGSPQWVLINFEEECSLSSFEVEFQGGFAGKNCHIEAGNDKKELIVVESFSPEDKNKLQRFNLKNQKKEIINGGCKTLHVQEKGKARADQYEVDINCSFSASSISDSQWILTSTATLSYWRYRFRWTRIRVTASSYPSTLVVTLPTLVKKNIFSPNTSGGRRLNNEISGDAFASLLLPGTGSCGIIFASKSDDKWDMLDP
ncbi:Nuclear receptor 2C2-associated protein [Trachymyrmex cornetzi]|uniref:Nuclear receptor 2C2-associated protein n=1 Tax=Trachymyrmex cornetzi TaxID=471704 RepID=A0A195D9R2_9HYME|nr:Nuclear receptor 2C2-associated protein [Trachymyrmex cornetzi]